MITQDTPINEQITFYENLINQYIDVIKVNPKGENSKLWIEWVVNWNREIIDLQKQQELIK